MHVVNTRTALQVLSVRGRTNSYSIHLVNLSAQATYRLTESTSSLGDSATAFPSPHSPVSLSANAFGLSSRYGSCDASRKPRWSGIRLGLAWVSPITVETWDNRIMPFRCLYVRSARTKKAPCGR